MKARDRRKRNRGRSRKAESVKKQAGLHKPKGLPRRTLPWLFALGLFVAGLAIYAPALSGPFFLDDYDLLEGFSAVRTGGRQAILGTGRPLLMLSFVANYRWAGFEDPFSYHLVNVLLHCLNAFLLWRLMGALFAPGRLDDFIPPSIRPLVVYGVPALFLTSPMQTESVAYISSRSEVLGGTFYLAALWAFASPLREKRPWPTAFLVILLFGCAVACKQDKMTLPIVVVLMDYLLLARLEWRKMRPSIPTYILFVGAVVTGFFIFVEPFLFAKSAGFNLPWQEYLLTQFRMHFLYLRLLVLPVGLNVDRHIAASESIWQHFSWLGLLGLLALAAIAFLYRRKNPLISFGILFYLVVLAPTTSFFPLLDFAAERRVYLPSIGFFLLLVLFISRLARSRNKTVAALTSLVLLYCVGTFQRARLWGDDLALWHDTAEKSPEKYRPLTWLGKLYDERGRPELAARYWEKAEQLVEPGTEDHGYLLSNLGLAEAKRKNYEKAVEYYKQSLDILPNEQVIWANLAVAQLRLGREEEGWKSFERALQINKANPEVYFLRAQELYQRGRYAEAVHDLEIVVKARPEDARARQNLRAARAKLEQQGPQGGGDGG